MERAPLPPHERSWRHPSELAADARASIRTERASTTARVGALLGGTAAIGVFGLGVLAFTPNGDDGPAATGSSPIQRLTVMSGSAAPNPGPATTLAAFGTVGPAPVGPVANHIGATGLAVVPSRSVVDLLDHRASGATRTANGPRIDVVGRREAVPDVTIVVTVHGGTPAVASVLDAGDGDGLAIVRVHAPAPDGFEIAAGPLRPGDLVTVLAERPVEVAWTDDAVIDDGGVDDVEIPDGTAAVDTNGHLAAVYVNDEDGTTGRLIPIDDAVVAATTPPD